MPITWTVNVSAPRAMHQSCSRLNSRRSQLQTHPGSQPGPRANPKACHHDCPWVIPWISHLNRRHFRPLSAMARGRLRRGSTTAFLLRGNSQAIILRCGTPLQRNLCFSSNFSAKAAAWSSVCRLSRWSDIHSRMIVRRALCSGFILPCPSKLLTKPEGPAIATEPQRL
jgi:hypothetical protein